jgi:hypothetical protein
MEFSDFEVLILVVGAICICYLLMACVLICREEMRDHNDQPQNYVPIQNGRSSIQLNP